MSKRLIAVCLCVIAVPMLAQRVTASERDAESPTSLRRIRMVGSGALLGFSLLCEEVGTTHQTVPVELCVDGQDVFSCRPLGQPEVSVQTVHALDWKCLHGNPIAKTLGYVPTLAVAHLSPAQHQIIVTAALRGAHPILTLKPDGDIWTINFGNGFADDSGSISAMLDKQFKQVQGYEVVQIDEDTGADVEQPAEPILPLFDGDGISPPGKKVGVVGFSLDDVALGCHNPQMPLDSPNWIIPGVLAIRLAFRPIESVVASSDGVDYAFAKPNGEMIVVKSGIPKAEAKAAASQRRKAFSKRHGDTGDIAAAVGKGD